MNKDLQRQVDKEKREKNAEAKRLEEMRNAGASSAKGDLKRRVEAEKNPAGTASGRPRLFAEAEPGTGRPAYGRGGMARPFSTAGRDRMRSRQSTTFVNPSSPRASPAS